MVQFSTESSPSQILISIHRCAQICRSHLSRSPIHHKIAIRKQDSTLFTGSHVHTSFLCVRLIHRRANILHVKHDVNWFTTHSQLKRAHLVYTCRLRSDGSTHAVHTCIPFSQSKPCSQVHIHFLHTHAVQLFKCVHPAIRRKTLSLSLLNVLIPEDLFSVGAFDLERK